MTDIHGVPEPGKTGEAQRTPASRKVEAEARNFQQPAASTAPTNLEARHTAPSGAPFELADVWRDALAPLFTAQLEASRWFDQVWRQGLGALPALRVGQPFAGLGAAGAFGIPAADLRETDKAYQLSLELPGLTRDDIELKIERDGLLIRGEKAEEKEEGRADYRVSERRYGRFERTFPIPPDVKRDDIAASYADGVLKIDLPKAEEARAESKRIEIR